VWLRLEAHKYSLWCHPGGLSHFMLVGGLRHFHHQFLVALQAFSHAMPRIHERGCARRGRGSHSQKNN